jgi:hypothetical protein
MAGLLFYNYVIVAAAIIVFVRSMSLFATLKERKHHVLKENM